MFSRLKSDEKKLRTDKLRYPELNEYQGGGGRRQNKIPVWAFFSYIELGEFINIYGYLNLQYQKEILKYGYTRDKYTKEVAKNVDTWLNAIRNLRNVCAHHAKLVGIKSVEIATENSEANILISKEDLLSRMYALKKILNENDAEQLKIDVKKLISKTKIEVYRMEILPEDWEERYDRINNL